MRKPSASKRHLILICYHANRGLELAPPPPSDLHRALLWRARDSQSPLCIGREWGPTDRVQTIDAKRSDGNWPGIYKSTTGILVFGMPFRGAGGLNQAEILQVIQNQYEDGQIQGSKLNILAPGNETLMDLMDVFFETRQERNMARVACFF